MQRAKEHTASNEVLLASECAKVAAEVTLLLLYLGSFLVCLSAYVVVHVAVSECTVGPGPLVLYSAWLLSSLHPDPRVGSIVRGCRPIVGRTLHPCSE